MPANVETMFYVRETPWHGLGKRLEEAPTSEKALKAAGLDWEVNKKPVYLQLPNGEFQAIPNKAANARSSDNKVLGIMSDGYHVVQNKEAFAFTDELLGEGVVYETAGSLNGGRRIWLLARLPEIYKALGEEIIAYICFSNSFDGFSGIRVMATPIRVVCQNTLDLAISGAPRTWSVYHTPNALKRMDEAKKTLNLANNYYKNFTIEADKLAEVRVDFEELTEKLFPIDKDTGVILARNMEVRRDDLLKLLQAPDLIPFQGTGWGFLNGVSDMVSHKTPVAPKTDAWRQARLAKAFDGFELLNKAQNLVRKVA